MAAQLQDSTHRITLPNFDVPELTRSDRTSVRVVESSWIVSEDAVLTRNSKWGGTIAAVMFILICIATLTPETPASPAGPTEVCRGWCDDSHVADFVRNIVLFVPLGFGLRLAGIRSWKVILMGSCLSAIVELLQIRIIVGRDASILDWISNTTGAAGGAIAAARMRMLLCPRPEVAVRILTVSLLAWVGILTLGAWGVQPAPTKSPFWGQRVPQLGDSPAFQGELISARVNEVELQPGRMKSDSDLRASMGARRFSVHVTVRPAVRGSPSSIEPIGRVADRKRREILMLGRGGNELVFRYRMRATTLRLETPAFALAGAFHDDATSNDTKAAPPESLSAVVNNGIVELSAKGQHVNQERIFELGPAIAWSFFLPWDYWFGPSARLIAHLWLAALLFPSGYWMTVTMRKWGGTSVLVAISCVILGALLVLPSIFDLPLPHVWEFVAAGGGLAAGWMCGFAFLPRPVVTKQALADDLSVAQ